MLRVAHTIADLEREERVQNIAQATQGRELMYCKSIRYGHGLDQAT